MEIFSLIYLLALLAYGLFCVYLLFKRTEQLNTQNMKHIIQDHIYLSEKFADCNSVKELKEYVMSLDDNGEFKVNFSGYDGGPEFYLYFYREETDDEYEKRILKENK